MYIIFLDYQAYSLITSQTIAPTDTGHMFPKLSENSTIFHDNITDKSSNYTKLITLAKKALNRHVTEYRQSAETVQDTPHVQQCTLLEQTNCKDSIIIQTMYIIKS